MWQHPSIVDKTFAFAIENKRLDLFLVILLMCSTPVFLKRDDELKANVSDPTSLGVVLNSTV